MTNAKSMAILVVLSRKRELDSLFAFGRLFAVDIVVTVAVDQISLTFEQLIYGTIRCTNSRLTVVP